MMAKKEISVKTNEWEEVKPLTKTVNDLEGKLVNLLTTTIKYYECNIFPDAIEIIKAKYLDNSDRALLLQQVYWKDYKFRSNETYPLMQQMIDIFCANLYDSDTRASSIKYLI